LTSKLGLAPAVAAITFTDATAPAVAGLTPRQLREFVREHALPHARVGRRMVVRVDLYLAAIDRLSGGSPASSGESYDEAAVVARAAGVSR
jgi:hypothetical protein